MVFCRCSARQNEHSITPIVLECMSGSPLRSSQMETEADGVSHTVRVTHRAVPSRHKKQQEKQLNTHINCSSFIDKHHTLSKKLWFLIRLGYTPDFHKKRRVGCNRNFCCHTPQWKSTNSMQHPVLRLRRQHHGKISLGNGSHGGGILRNLMSSEWDFFFQTFLSVHPE